VAQKPHGTVLFGRGRPETLCYDPNIDRRGRRNILRSYSTSSAARSARLTYWNDLHCSVFSPLEVKPVDRDTFDAALGIDRLGPLTVAKTLSAAATIEQTDRHIAQTHERRTSLLMPIQGRLACSHYGHDAELDEGDFLLSDSFAPGRTSFAGPNRALIVSLPYDVLTLHIPDPERIFGRPMSGSLGFGQMVGSMLRALWTQVEAGLPSHVAAGVAKSFLDLVATAYALDRGQDIPGSCVASARRAQIKRFIERHLRDADLTANAVAAGLGLSSRYVRMVFTSEGETVSDYIMRRRLEECARQLTNTLWQGRSITETAFDWGFSSMPHFTRAFKERFTVTPSDYRRSRS
jgi:AraC-like DNA-binding protein